MSIGQVARDFGIHQTTLSSWLRTADVDEGPRSSASPDVLRENRDLKRRDRLLEHERGRGRRTGAASRAAGAKHGFRDAYQDPDRIAELIDAGKATLDPAEREQIYSELQQLLYDDPMWVYAAQEGLAYPYRSRLTDFVVNPLWRGPHYEYYGKG